MNGSAMTSRERIIEIIASEFGVIPEDVTPAALLVEDLGADSFDLQCLTFALEEELEISISDDDEAAWRTVADLMTYLEARVIGMWPATKGDTAAAALPS